MSEEYKEVEQTESKAEPTESGADKETENVADKEAEQTGAEMEAVKETDQTETQEIETKRPAGGCCHGCCHTIGCLCR